MPKIPVSIQAAISPNPNAMKFIANVYLIDPTKKAEFKTVEEAEEHSELAVGLFQFPYVEQVFIARDFITITKKEHYTWDFLIRPLRDYIRNYIAIGKTVVKKFPEETPIPTIAEESTILVDYTPSEYDTQIKDLFYRKVTKVTEKDGGTIIFRNYNNGVVTVLLKGACHACPISDTTLAGIKKILDGAKIPVKEVVSENNYPDFLDKEEFPDEFFS